LKLDSPLLPSFVGVAKRASPARFGPTSLWPAKNGLGWAVPPPINGLDIATRPVLGQAGGPADWSAGWPVFFYYYFFRFFNFFLTFYKFLFINLIYIYIYIYLYNIKKVLFFNYFLF